MSKWFMTRRQMLGSSAGMIVGSELAASRDHWTNRASAAEATPWAQAIDNALEGELMERRVINPWKWQDEFGFVQAIEVTAVQKTLICAGQASQDGDGVPIHAGDMGAQTTQALDNLEAVLGQAGFTMADVVRVVIYTTDVDRFLAEGMEAWGGRLAATGCQPTTTLLGIARLAYPDLLIEFEATAVS